MNKIWFILLETFKFIYAAFIISLLTSTYQFLVSEDQIKKFLIEIQQNKDLLDQVMSVGTAEDIARIANDSGFEFTGTELKNISKKVINGVKIKSQDTSPSYNFGEEGN